MPTPSLTLNWSSGSLPGSVTHGGGANGTKWSSAGVLTAGSSGRITYDPTTLAALGLLVEEARTNAALDSQTFTSAGSWAAQNATGTANTTTSPDGTADADTWNVGTVTGSTDASDVFGVNDDGISLSTKTALSIFAKAGTGRYFGLGQTGTTNPNEFTMHTFDAQGGVAGTFYNGSGIGTLVSGPFVYSTINGFFFFGFAGLASGGVGNWTNQLTASGSLSPSTANVTAFAEIFGSYGPFTEIIWQIQAEAGSFPSSPIVTTSAAVTRTADTATKASTADAAIVIKGRAAIFIDSGQVQTLWSRDDGTAANVIKIIRNASNEIRLQVVTASASQADVLLGTVANKADFVASARFATNDFAGALLGGTVATDTSGSVPTVTTDRFGYSAVGADYWMSTIARIDFFTTLNNSELISGGDTLMAQAVM